MNDVKLSGTLTKAPFIADKGWAAATLAVQRPGTTFSLWVPIYAPVAVADAFKNLKGNEVFTIEGELDQKKDKTFQVKVLKVSKAGSPAISNIRAVYITDDDLPEF